MDYSIIRLQGHQHKVSVGDEILVDKLGEKKPEAEVLLKVSDKKVEIGTPILEKVKIAFEVMGDEKGKKLHVRKFKSKSRYRKHIGHRSEFTRLKIKKVS